MKNIIRKDCQMFLKISNVFFLMFIFLKQFYLMESGSFQLGDLCLFLSIILFITCKVLDKKKDDRIYDFIEKKDILFIVFVFLALIIDGINYIKYKDLHLILSGMYFIYNMFAIILFKALAKSEMLLQIGYWMFRINIFAQTLFWCVGIGKYRFEHRWCGTFNDPNQMAFFLMCCLFITFYLSEIRGKHLKSEIIDWVCVIFLLILSKSTGITAGFLSFGVLYIGYILHLKLKKKHISKVKVMFATLGGILAIGIGVVFVVKIQLEKGDSYNLVTRIIEKVQLISNGGIKSILADRGMDKLWIAPKNIFFGAGDGAFERYSQYTTAILEIHCTPIGILYSYGIIPFCILCYWVYQNIKKLPLIAYIIYISLFVESMFLVNYRQPFFWIIIVLGSIWQIKLENKSLESE